MENKNTPAFPEVTSDMNPDWQVSSVWSEGGLTKREWFTGMILQGILSNKEMTDQINTALRIAIAYADALLKELEREESKGK